MVALITFYRGVEAAEDVLHGRLQQQGRLDIAAKILAIRNAAFMLGFAAPYLLTKNLVLTCAVNAAITLILCIVLNKPFANGAAPEAAASGRAGFLTATYVVMIPCVQRITGKKLSLPVIIAVCGCITGMYLLCMSGGFGKIYLGDLLELLCAAAFTAHILTIDRFGKTDGIVLSFIQFITCGILSAVGMFIFENDFSCINI